MHTVYTSNELLAAVFNSYSIYERGFHSMRKVNIYGSCFYGYSIIYSFNNNSRGFVYAQQNEVYFIFIHEVQKTTTV